MRRSFGVALLGLIILGVGVGGGYLAVGVLAAGTAVSLLFGVVDLVGVVTIIGGLVGVAVEMIRSS